ncbi:hypothetical protein [Kineococcus sp. SYSU DK005]|uniref:hypothetical protein n=1 Tax=Kineococcus sp. SYSU DK005 TaxID=3383126 RepID=UPI003D7D52E5
MSLDDPAHAVLLGRMTQEGESPLALLPLSAGPLGNLSGAGAGALAVGTARLWLSQPQLVGGPSVASVPLGSVGAVGVRERRALPALGALRVEVVVDGRPLRFSTRAGRAAVDAFARALDAARQAPPG